MKGEVGWSQPLLAHSSTPPHFSSPPKTPLRSYSAQTPPRNGNPTPPPPGGRVGHRRGREARTGPRPTQTHCDPPATARLRRGRPLTTLQPTKRQPASVGAVEQGGRVTTARQTTTRAAPGCRPPQNTHACAALRQLTMHISTNDLNCCKPARLRRGY